MALKKQPGFTRLVRRPEAKGQANLADLAVVPLCPAEGKRAKGESQPIEGRIAQFEADGWTVAGVVLIGFPPPPRR